MKERNERKEGKERERKEERKKERKERRKERKERKDRKERKKERPTNLRCFLGVYQLLASEPQGFGLSSSFCIKKRKKKQAASKKSLSRSINFRNLINSELMFSYCDFEAQRISAVCESESR